MSERQANPIQTFIWACGAGERWQEQGAMTGFSGAENTTDTSD